MLTALDDSAVGQWCRAAVEALSSSRSRLDELNVFPVPDGDTGTNLLHTAEGALAALDAAGPDEPAWPVLARGAVLAARGNSGTILAQLLRGLADQLADEENEPAHGSEEDGGLESVAPALHVRSTRLRGRPFPRTGAPTLRGNERRGRRVGARRSQGVGLHTPAVDTRT